MKLFRNGSVQMSGCKSISDINIAISKLISILETEETGEINVINFKIDNILVTGGILAKDLGIKFWQVAEDENLKKICNNYNIFPNYIISNLRI